MPLRVAIIGGGIGGLVLAQLLRIRNNPDVLVQVFERDATAEARDQGYYLGLTGETVALLQPTFENLPKLAELLKDSRSTYTAARMVDANHNILVNFPVPAGGCFINRVDLRQALLQGLDVQWNKQFVSYSESLEDGAVHIQFRDGSTATADILVGADGANSPVREQRAPAVRYNDLGVTTIAGVSPLESASPAIRTLVNDGLVRWLGPDGHTVMMFPVFAVKEGQQSQLMWVLSYPGQRADWEGKFSGSGEDVTDEYSESSHARQALMEDCVARTQARFAPDLADIIRATPTEVNLFGPRQIYSTEVAQVRTLLSPPCGRVILLGDAAHATTTHRGLGANTAVADAADLAQSIAGAAGDSLALIQALQQYEKVMVARGIKVIKESVQVTGSIHSSGWSATWIRPAFLRVINVLIRLFV
ncbi:hypothetical protein CAOG_00660 [Capsaspora owczarzaki ATCC 30864]|uniref:FAD-binding domain-containing protein n=1 Tax=Capsaspora owczarzaki (strain ATCC 30864) TaxID=595528 RepID=A0A0D2U1T1_CAPO3|nr:hypothetical protein CAOG_00660 [Capsaspora owczarzaki ATCC 30864]KJE89126.1 hypothetical protein CAOG_000660 [Capsaspora owczarzaki ATCC 30864]|eukprot:XP_004365531.1 hypothetical protein CAOG_00660 [Capsaspora owczarzaki ATCC 30864]